MFFPAKWLFGQLAAKKLQLALEWHLRCNLDMTHG
jgi:hypothetical protein